MDDVTNPKHTKITTYKTEADGSLTTITESYFEGLASRKMGVVKHIRTDYNNFMTDLIASVDVITKQQTKELDLKITVDEWGKPCHIVKQYIIKHEDFKRR